MRRAFVPALVDVMDIDNNLAAKVAHGHQLALAAAMMLSRAASNFLLVKGDAFTNLFAAKIRLLLSRDPDPLEFQLTVFDRILLVMTGNGADLESTASIVFFLRNYYDFDLDVNYTDQPVPGLDLELSVFGYGAEANDHHPGARDSATALPSSSTHVNEDHTRVDLGTNLDPTLQHLLNAYEEACIEYFSVETLQNEDTLKAAKYLRDTAENATLYLNESNIGCEKLRDIQVMSATAKSVVQDLSGGKVRKFDEGYQTEKPKDASRKSKSQARPSRGRPRTWQLPNLPRTNTHLPAGQLGRSEPRIMPPAEANAYSRRFDDHSYRTEYRAVAPTHEQAYRIEHYANSPVQERAYSRREEEFGRHAGRRSQSPARSPSRAGPYCRGHELSPFAQERPYSRHSKHFVEKSSQGSRSIGERNRYASRPSERDAARGANVSEKNKQRGRGHSGIPYGYSADRDVDSYKPGGS